jgi:hypothetical protein
VLTAFQQFWVALCSLGPAIVIGVTKSWWLGFGALVLYFLLSAVLGWLSLAVVPYRLLSAWGYAKNLLIASIILILGFSVF